VESGDDSDEPPDEVFMPPGDMFAARCMAVAYVESLLPFTSPGAAIAEAIFTELPGLHVTLVPSSLGDMYAKFLSEEDRELTVLHQHFHLDGATICLVREEEADRVPCDMQWVALVLVRRVPVEHLSQLNISAALSSFGTVLEVDGACLCGTDYASVRVVVLLKDAQRVPREVLLTRLPWGSRLITIRKVRVRRATDSYNADGEYVHFFSPPPPPYVRTRTGHLPLAPPRLPPAPDTTNLDDVDARSAVGLAHEALLALLDSVASSPTRASSPPSSL
jgi:hypothetical protein